jgi:hypothetical protein
MNQIETDYSKRNLLDRMYLHTLGARRNIEFADIDQFTNGAMCKTDNCPRGADCEDTVWFDGHCWKTNQLNYVIAGKIISILYGNDGVGAIAGYAFIILRTEENPPEEKRNKMGAYRLGLYGMGLSVVPTGPGSDCPKCDESFGPLTTKWPPYREDIP